MPTFDLDEAIVLEVSMDGMRGPSGGVGPPGAPSTVPGPPGPPGVIDPTLQPITSVANVLTIDLETTYTGYIHTLTQNTTLSPVGDLDTAPRSVVFVGGASNFTVTWATNITWKSGRPRAIVTPGQVIYTEIFSRNGVYFGVVHPAPLGPSGRHGARYSGGSYKLYYEDIDLPVDPDDRDFFVDIDWNDGAGDPDPITAGLTKAGDHVSDITSGA